MGPALGWGQLFEQLEKSLSALGLRGVPKKQAGYAGFFISCLLCRVAFRIGHSKFARPRWLDLGMSIGRHHQSATPALLKAAFNQLTT